MQMFFSIAFGGALGALARYFLSKNIDNLTGNNFPFGILICNIIGSLILGLLYESLLKSTYFSDNLKLFLQAGVLGSFTTFSAFSLEAFLMIEKGNFSMAGLFIISSVFLSIIGLILGIYFYKLFG
ncbi:MAG: fluoride efflux transporter CrcB [Rickettsiales bacterium]|nr:fluoride efflux transporter CrcB [Rickettsiales bacterium]